MVEPASGAQALIDDEARRCEAIKNDMFTQAIKDWHPTGNRIMLREAPRPQEEKFGGIIVPDTKQKRGRECIVIAAGPDAEYEVGTRVIVGTYQGVIVDMAPRVTVLISDGAEILMTFEDETAGPTRTALP